MIYSAEDSEEVSLVSEEVSEDSALLSSEEALSPLLSEAADEEESLDAEDVEEAVL